jgi:hypothetical protein
MGEPLRAMPKASPAPEPGERLSPADHVHLLTELLRSASPDLARRWLHALLRVPEPEREAMVLALEARVLAEFGPLPGVDQPAGVSLWVHYPPEQRTGYVEERIVEYAHVPEPKAPRAKREKAPAKRAKRA